jgi:hypothetical protein
MYIQNQYPVINIYHQPQCTAEHESIEYATRANKICINLTLSTGLFGAMKKNK